MSELNNKYYINWSLKVEGKLSLKEIDGIIQSILSTKNQCNIYVKISEGNTGYFDKILLVENKVLKSKLDNNYKDNSNNELSNCVCGMVVAKCDRQKHLCMSIHKEKLKAMI